MNNDEIKTIIKECDKDDDGQISYEEFIGHIKGYQEAKLKRQLGLYVGRVGRRSLADSLKNSDKERSRSEFSRGSNNEIESQGRNKNITEGEKADKRKSNFGNIKEEDLINESKSKTKTLKNKKKKKSK